jgi:hypothetical protein
MRVRIGAVVVAGMLLLSGCGGGDPIPTLPPTPSATPIFASEEEALAAAEEAYAAYLEMWDSIASGGGVDPERLADYASGDFYEAELEGFETFRDNGWHAVGRSVLLSVDLQFADLTGQESIPVAAYVCVDVGSVDVLDGSGVSVVSPDRPDLQAFEVFFVLSAPGKLVPTSREPWEPEAVCSGT